MQVKDIPRQTGEIIPYQSWLSTDNFFFKQKLSLMKFCSVWQSTALVLAENSSYTSEKNPSLSFTRKPLSTVHQVAATNHRYKEA